MNSQFKVASDMLKISRFDLFRQGVEEAVQMLRTAASMTHIITEDDAQEELEKEFQLTEEVLQDAMHRLQEIEACVRGHHDFDGWKCRWCGADGSV